MPVDYMQLVRYSIDSIQFEKYLPLFYVKNVWIRRNKFLVIGKMVDVQMVIQVVGKLGYQIDLSFLKMVTQERIQDFDIVGAEC